MNEGGDLKLSQLRAAAKRLTALLRRAGGARSNRFAVMRSGSLRVLARSWYAVLWCVCWAISKVWFRFQFSGRQHVPKSGPLLLLANHQSNLDPVLVGIACPRQLRYLAKKSLFFWPLSWWIRSLGAVPIDLDGSAMSGLKTMLRLLREDEAVVVFPEGSRTRDGRLQPLKPGFCPLARRSGAAIVPLAIDGSFAALPIHAKFPWPARVSLQFGPPIQPGEIAQLTDDQLVKVVATRIAALLREPMSR